MKKVKALVPFAEGFEDLEAIGIVDILRRAGIQVDTAGLNRKKVKGSRGTVVEVDMKFGEVNVQTYDIIALPGGMPGSANLRDDERILRAVREMYEERKLVAAICAAPVVLYRAGILEGKRFTIHPSARSEVDNRALDVELVVDENVVTAWSAGTVIKFALKLVELVCGAEKVREVQSSLLYGG